MKLDRVTITGADNSVSADDLRDVSREFPFVEWGILVSALSEGSTRFPRREWLADYQRVAKEHALASSLHVCGLWTRELLLGTNIIPPAMLDGFQRIQLNFHAERTPCNQKPFYQSLQSLGMQQFIFQIDGATGNRHLESVFELNDGPPYVDAVPLFDISGGTGILPSEWPKPEYMKDDVNYVYHGYAGGLGPDNLEQQLPLIAAAAGDAQIWIDMETRVRSNNDKQFDLDKVRRCLAICKPVITP